MSLSFFARVFLTIIVVAVCASDRVMADEELTPLGVAQVDITPEQPVRMYGYASRIKESAGVAGPLRAKALAIGGNEGEGPAVLLCVDNGAVPTDIREEVFNRVTAKVPVKRERFMLANAHCHSGPNLKGMDSFSGEQLEHMKTYASLVVDRLEAVVLEALAARRPGRLAWGQGTVGFAANRRVLKDGKWAGFGAVPDGPTDHSLPVLRVTDEAGKLMGVVVNYACHCTTLRGDFPQIHGDWAGCAQEYIEADHPGALALISIGCGADSDPAPHGTVELCQQHGRALADEVKRVLQTPLRPVEPRLTARTVTLDFPYSPPPSLETLKESAKQSWAIESMVKRIARGDVLAKSEPYEIAVWAFGDDLAMIFLNDEVVVDYALRLKRELDGSRLWITAYTNDVSHYIASDRLLKEGGYEVRNSLSTAVTFGRPEELRPSMEERIIGAVRELVPQEFHRQ